MILVEQSKVIIDGSKYLYRNKKGKYYLVRKVRIFVEVFLDGILNLSLFKQLWVEMDYNEGLIFLQRNKFIKIFKYLVGKICEKVGNLILF